MSSEAREPIFVFLDQIGCLLTSAEQLLTREDLPAEVKAVGESAIAWMAQVHGELTEARGHFEADEQSRGLANEALVLSGSVGLMAAQADATAAAETPEETGVSIGKALDWTKTGIDKVLEFLPDNPLKKLLKDVSILLPQIKGLIEQVADRIGELTLDVEEVEAKIEWLIHQLLGNPLIKNPDAKGGDRIPGITDGPHEPTLPGSVLWYLWDIERKLEYLWKRIEGGVFPRPGANELISKDDPKNRGEPIGEEIDELCYKIDCLAKLLGKTLYNAEWDCDPDHTHVPTPPPPDGEWLHPLTADGHRGWDATPPKSVKDEIHDIEECLDEIKECLDEIKDCLDELKTPEEPPPEDPQVAADLKRILVYEADVFTAGSTADERVVDVRSAAFDLAGWVDLTDLEDGDAVSISLFVNLPGPVRRLYRETSYTGGAEAGLKSLQDIVGPTIVVGDHVEVVLRQTASATGFADGLEIPYQFVVETQRLPI